MSGLETIRIPIGEISLGVPCQYDIHDDQGLLLASRGQAFTKELYDRLIQREITHIELCIDDAESLLGASPDASSESPKKIPSKQRTTAAQVDSNTPFRELRIDRTSEPHSAQRAETFNAQISASVEQVANVGRHIHDLHVGEVQAIYDLPCELLAMLLEDGDQSIASLRSAESLDGLASRCTRMSLLAINMGIEMDFDNEAVVLLGKAGLLHDLGLYKVRDSLRDPGAALTDEERFEYRRHPNMTCDLLNRFNLVSEEVKVLIGQVHERANGTGYPRGLHSNALHPLAKILGIVDGYLGLIDPGPGRPPLHPHDAIGLLLHEGGRGVFGAAELGAFLKQMTLFPIGSQVRLDDGSEAKVIRRDGNHYATPIVQTADSDLPISTRKSERSIVGSVVSSQETEMRLPVDMLAYVTYESLVAVA